MVENIIQINGGITPNVGMSGKNLHVFKKDYVWNPATWSCENGDYLASIMDGSVIMCDEIKGSYDKETKLFQKTLMKKVDYKTTKFLYFTCIFVDCFSNNDSCQYLLLSDKLSNKT